MKTKYFFSGVDAGNACTGTGLDAGADNARTGVDADADNARTGAGAGAGADDDRRPVDTEKETDSMLVD